jgi:HEAT repeat protein
MVTREALESQWHRAAETTEFSEHQAFIKQLLSLKDPEGISYHYSLLRDHQNLDLYRDLRAAFAKRGDAGANYLIERISVEKDPHLLDDILLLLGVMRRPEATPLARKFANSVDSKLRDTAASVLGWVGTESDADLLRNLLLHDPEPRVRGDAATAHSQMEMRLPQSRARLLDNLKQALDREVDEDVLAWIIITIQYILRKNFGLKEHIDEGTRSGDVMHARQRARAALLKRKDS